MNEDTRIAILVAGGISAVAVVITACILVGTVVESVYAPGEATARFRNQQESRALARDLLRPCAEAP